MVGFRNKVFRVQIPQICIGPAFLVFKPIIDGECPWANEDTHKLLSLNARRTMIATTSEHMLNAQPTLLYTALVVNCTHVRLDTGKKLKLPAYYPEYLVRWNINATNDIHMTYNTNPDGIVQRCQF